MLSRPYGTFASGRPNDGHALWHRLPPTFPTRGAGPNMPSLAAASTSTSASVSPRASLRWGGKKNRGNGSGGGRGSGGGGGGDSSGGGGATSHASNTSSSSPSSPLAIGCNAPSWRQLSNEGSPRGDPKVCIIAEVNGFAPALRY
jgi:hypothetical protein